MPKNPSIEVGQLWRRHDDDHKKIIPAVESPNGDGWGRRGSRLRVDRGTITIEGASAGSGCFSSSLIQPGNPTPVLGTVFVNVSAPP